MAWSRSKIRLVHKKDGLREASLQALLRELAAFNKGLCIITTRLPVTDIADHEGTSALRRDLEHLSSDAGAKLLRALDVKGDEPELRTASDEFSGHCLALTLLGSYLTDAVQWRHPLSQRSVRTSCSRCTTGSPRQKSDGILPDLVWGRS